MHQDLGLVWDYKAKCSPGLQGLSLCFLWLPGSCGTGAEEMGRNNSYHTSSTYCVPSNALITFCVLVHFILTAEELQAPGLELAARQLRILSCETPFMGEEGKEGQQPWGERSRRQHCGKAVN